MTGIANFVLSLSLAFLAIKLLTDRRDLKRNLGADHSRRVDELLNANNLSLTTLRADRDEWKRRAEIAENDAKRMTFLEEVGISDAEVKVEGWSMKPMTASFTVSRFAVDLEMAAAAKEAK